MTGGPGAVRVLIAGGGVAGLEATLALRQLAGERVTITLLAPEPDFVVRPMRVREPFALALARHYPLSELAADLGIALEADAFRWLDGDRRVVHTDGGRQLPYDALLLALGAVQRPSLTPALTLDDRQLDEQLHGVIQDVEDGYVRSLAFVIPAPVPWPIPVYEIALMTARRAWDMNAEVSITLVTPESAPLAVLGDPASDTVAQRLAEHGITVLTSTTCSTPEPGRLALHPGDRSLAADRIIALPTLFGPPTPGVPKSAPDEFIDVDVHGRVSGLAGVYAAGDLTTFPIRHGSLAAAQADAAAEAIAAFAGAAIEPRPFTPILLAALLGDDEPLYMRARLNGEHGSHSVLSRTPMWSPPTEIVARHLAPYLEAKLTTAPQREPLTYRRLDHRPDRSRAIAGEHPRV